MKFKDFQNREITLSDESWRHIQDSHPEMSVLEIARVLLSPDEVRRSIHTVHAELYYSLKTSSPKLRYRCVIVKVVRGKCFVSSAMTTSSMKMGATLYRKS
ncbi:hypothetical protein D3C87_125490 [compost metagenome]